MHSWQVQVAIRTALLADATLVAMVSGILDAPLANQTFPYITIGESTHTPDDLLIQHGAQSTLILHIWSRYEGMREAKEIMDRMYIVLHDKPLPVTGTQTVSCLFEFCEVIRDADGETQHGVMRFRVETFG